ncbi:MAG TPA: 4-hydroxyphenylacetate 3-hydroxylase N-terminal domain-containing protein [Planctomycetota bacterium]|nr:4-hydroxyphenylacetate 3-hydroxylase N-terminal domain-containing protein [Planctomycetota bacterium]
MRTGQQYIASIKDERRIYVDGKKIESVLEAPGFHGIVKTIAQLYDFAADPKNGMTYTAPETGQAANRVFAIPRSREDLALKRTASAAWARQTHGLVGRSPDHVGAFMAAFASDPGFFDAPGRPLGKNVTAFYRKMLVEDLYLSYAIIPPQIDRSKTAQSLEEKFLQVGVVKETDGGVIVRGAQMLGTASTICNYILVSCIVPLKPGDEDYANTFVVPAGAPGLKLYCRPLYAQGKSSVYDYPLSTRFDETDALLVFDDVFIPWEQVFVYRDVERVRNQFFATPAHVLGNTQAQVRLCAKMEFLAGLARKIAAVNQIDSMPGVMEKLGELASLASIVEGMVLAAEASCALDKNGVAKSNPRFLYGAMGLQAELIPRALGILRELAGGGVLQVPSSFHELLADETAADMARYIRSPGVSAEERIKLFRLVWDMVGTEFGGRHHQYEMFYAGAPYVAKGYAFRNYGYDSALKLVNDCMAKYSPSTDM